MRPLMRTPMIARRTLSTTPSLRIKEDANRSPEQLEKAKQEQLKEQKEGKGRWREDLASHGESNIAADKEKVNDHDSHMKELQQEGKKKGEKGEL
jgi:predicted secreted protein